MRVFAKEYALISHALDSQESRTRPAKMDNSLAICTVPDVVLFLPVFVVVVVHILHAGSPVERMVSMETKYIR